MKNEIDVLPRNRQALLFEIMRANPSLPMAKARDRRTHPPVHRELIKLVQRLFLNGPQSAQAVVFSAVDRKSGCTYICTRTAEILANQLEEPVCLVDANFRSPGLNRQFEFENETSSPRYEEWTFTPVGTNQLEAKRSNLWLVSYTPSSPDCPRLASLDGFQTLIDDLRKDFTYILIDAPPLNEYAEASLFGRMADGLVLVLEAHDTRRESAQKAKEMLDAAGVPVLGAVLNKRTYPIPESLYRRL